MTSQELVALLRRKGLTSETIDAAFGAGFKVDADPNADILVVFFRWDGKQRTDRVAYVFGVPADQQEIEADIKAQQPDTQVVVGPHPKRKYH